MPCRITPPPTAAGLEPPEPGGWGMCWAEGDATGNSWDTNQPWAPPPLPRLQRSCWEPDLPFPVCGNKDTENPEIGVLSEQYKAPLGMSVIKATSPLKGSSGHKGRGRGFCSPAAPRALRRDGINLHLSPPSSPHIHDGLLPRPGFQEAPLKPAFFPQTTRPRRILRGR